MTSTSTPNSQQEEHVLVSVNRATRAAVVTLNRPRRANALTGDMVKTLRREVLALDQRDDVNCIVLTGAGRYFCTGMDLGGNLTSNARDATKVFTDLCIAFQGLSKPTIARINGPVMGGGIGLAFLCDIRLCMSNAFIQFSEVKRGLVPAMISTFIVPQIGPFLAKELFITGRRLSAAEAWHRGIMTAMADSAEHLDKLTATYVRELLTSAPQAMALCKRLVNFYHTHDAAEHSGEAQRAFVECVEGEELRYGIACFAKKQKPDWTKMSKL